MPLPVALRSLRHRNFQLFFSGQLISLVDRALSTDPKRRPPAARLAAGLRAAAAGERRRPRQRSFPRLAPRTPPARLVPAAPAVLFAAWTGTALPFYPSWWWAGLAFLAGALATLSARAGLAFALAVPILPLGNYALGLALVYATLAALWLAVSWREPRAGLFCVLGPLLGPISALGLLPLAAQAVRSPTRRAAQVGGAVLAAAADSLREVHSIRDFLVAVQVGSQTAVGMLDEIEAALIKILRTVNEDAP